MPHNAAKNAATPQADSTTPKWTDKAATIGIQHPCQNIAAGCRWESPDNTEIDTVEEAQELTCLHITMCDTNPIVTQKKKECEHQRQLRWQRQECQEPDKQTISQEQLRKKDQSENTTNNATGPQDSGPKRGKGSNTAKTPEDSPTGKLEGNATTPYNNPTSKLENNAKTLTPPAHHLTAAAKQAQRQIPENHGQ